MEDIETITFTRDINYAKDSMGKFKSSQFRLKRFNGLLSSS
jgi:hypothetical protein